MISFAHHQAIASRPLSGYNARCNGMQENARLWSTRSVPHALSAAVMEDTQAGFHYLPDRDADVVKDWLYRPYGF